MQKDPLPLTYGDLISFFIAVVALRTSAVVLAVGLLAVSIVAGYAVLVDGEDKREAAPVPETVETKPQLYCVFFRLSGKEPRLELLFNVDREERFHFRQLYLIELNGSQRLVDAKDPPFPEWTFDGSVNPSRLSSEIRVVDNTAAGFHQEQITVSIYDYEPATVARQEFEASLTSIYYQNLAGRCTNVQVQRD
ncbi:hypothetical protein [Hyphomicrobium sp.]|uniref:hypothetical protein n=1 Tax=Hyphomicrobium sp. TaxID=82 RepID=UPI002CE45DA4|nr:hypothetical protein [Hyphomicrobium sp.]HRN89741.1 hypothetical protein [Hyphomicrobium sp.]HRQ27171.1 hypothetical protein [Hyphomicrobium sp.]